MRRARVALSVTCYCEATRVTAGERSDTETVTLRSARGNWRRAIARWYLASCLLNFDHPFYPDMYTLTRIGVTIYHIHVPLVRKEGTMKRALTMKVIESC